MKKNRRFFLHTAGAFTAGSLLIPAIGCQSTTEKGDQKAVVPSVTNEKKFMVDKFGIQLYTLKDAFTDDPREVLKSLASYGYQQIEGFEGKQGLWWGMGNQEYKKYLDGIGINMVSAHCDIHTDFEKKAAEAAEIGLEYLICPWIGPQKTVEGWKEVTDKFNNCGKICKANGIKFAYHNHAYSFKAFSGMIPHNFIMENTDPDLVDHEMDIYWVVTGGADPIEYLTKYSNRFRLCHIKDRMKNTDDDQASTNLGEGIIDFPTILKVAADNGMKYYIVEQERFDGSSPLESAKANADYMRKFA